VDLQAPQGLLELVALLVLVVQTVLEELVGHLEQVVLAEALEALEVLVLVEPVGLQELQEHQAHLEHRAPQVKMVYLEDLYTI
jgi:hypothetical protein